MNSSTNDIHFDSAVEFTNSDKSSKGELFSHAKFLSVIGIFCAVFLVAVFAFDYFLVQGSQTQKVMNDASVKQAPSTNQAHATVATSLEPIERQYAHLENNTRASKTVLSENDFRQEAQSMVFRDEGKQPTTLQAQVIEVNAAISNEDFKVEAEQVLYRDESK
ncbi:MULTISPECIES: hypothetical protein [unclassified Psychrobacter]|uniref:hypothetical protein n=1 Tax=unclassified Psychrobacter TaxID=196806 RepID=UPI0025D57144|nr:MULTISPECIES: hypothetical protein [unclassified Psychrobacter]